ncbi:MAG TPA: hypothetical protein VND64_14765 [Pirellulales bacterium]|nr:hypothetical protein [Pirellulales bacterium]
MASPTKKLGYEPRVECDTGREKSEDVAFVARQLGVVDELARIVAASEALFPGPVKVEVMWDPEIDELVFLVFNVFARGTDTEVMAHIDEWYRESTRIAGKNANYFTISLDMK